MRVVTLGPIVLLVLKRADRSLVKIGHEILRAQLLLESIEIVLESFVCRQAPDCLALKRCQGQRVELLLFQVEWPKHIHQKIRLERM